MLAQQWQQNFKFVEPIRTESSSFGLSIATYGNYAAFGASAVDVGSTLNAGKVHIAKMTCEGWVFYQELTLTGTEDYCGFGSILTMDNTTLAVYGCDPLNPRGGNAIYIYERNINDLYVFTQKITKPENVLWDNFASRMAISGDFMIVGASYNSTDNSLNNVSTYAGAAYIYFKDTSGVWSLVQKITASDRGAGDNFGESVDIYGNTIIIGAENEGANRAGAAYVFEKDANLNTWSEVTKLVAYDFRGLQDRFGGIVKVDKDIIAITARRDDDYDSALSGDGGGPLTSLGSVYIFKKNTSGIWQGIQKIRASNGSLNHLSFGDRLDLYDDIIAVRGIEYEYDINGNLSASYGNIYMFQKGLNGNFNEYQIIEQDIKHNSDAFGREIVLNGENFFIGAYWHDFDINEQNFLNDSGAIYLFNTYDFDNLKKPTINSIPILTACEDLGNGFSSSFSMSNIENSLVDDVENYVFYYKDEQGSDLPSPLPDFYTNSSPYSQRIYVRVENKYNSNCYEETEIELQTIQSFELNTIPDLYACDTTGNGFSVFNLSELNLDLVDDVSLYDFLYLDSNGNDISDFINESYENSTRNQEVITAVVTKKNTFCTKETTIVLNAVSGGVDCETEIIDLKIPKFFTPNGDGVNDVWKITEEFNQNYNVYIFDRYGKLLKRLNSVGSWDGNFNGYPLPSADYWYRIVFQDNTYKLGHFSLKR